MKSLTIALAIAAVMVTVPAWAASSGSLHAMANVSGASALTNDELSAVEGGIVVFGPGSFFTPVFTSSSNTFLNRVLAQQLGIGPDPVFVSNTTLTPSINLGTGAITLTPTHRIQVNTLFCVGCTGL
jgi:hypothetical protein